MNEYGALFYMFFRIGLFSFGGGYAMLPLIFQSVQDFGIMTAHEFSNLVALSQVTPGPVAVNAATYVGFNDAGVAGALAATLGVMLPSFILVITITYFLEKFKESKGLAAIFSGIRPATVGLIAAAAIFIARTSLVSSSFVFPVSSAAELANQLVQHVNVLPCVIFICTMILIGKCKFSPIMITIIMGTVGAFLCG